MIPDRSLYEDTAPPAPETVALEGEHTADLVVVGAGYTGLTAAIHAARRGLKVIVLEAADIGHGGSGRNHGHCVPVYRFLADARGLDKLDAARLDRRNRLLADSGRLVFDLIARYGIACEAAATGTLHVAHSAPAAERLARQQAFYARLGKASDLLDATAVARLTGTDAYRAGWVHREGGHLNPLAYVRGLAHGALSEGVAVFTGSPAMAVAEAPSGWRVRCPGGSVVSKGVAIATNAYTDGCFRRLAASFFTVEAFGIASDPVDPAARLSVLPGNHNVGDTHRETRFYRFDADNRLIVGGIVEPRRGRDFAATAALMSERMLGLFPQLGRLDWRWHWTGRLAMTLDMTPRLYRLGPRFFAMLGYSGRGVPTATALGPVLAAAAAGDAEAGLPWPVSPLGRVIGRSAFSALVPRLRGPFNRWRDRRGL